MCCGASVGRQQFSFRRQLILPLPFGRSMQVCEVPKHGCRGPRASGCGLSCVCFCRRCRHSFQRVLADPWNSKGRNLEGWDANVFVSVGWRAPSPTRRELGKGGRLPLDLEVLASDDYAQFSFEGLQSRCDQLHSNLGHFK